MTNLRTQLFIFMSVMLLCIVSFNYMDKPFVYFMNGLHLFSSPQEMTGLAKIGITKIWAALAGVGFIVIAISYARHGWRPWSRNLLIVCLSIAVVVVIGTDLKYMLGRYRPVMLLEHGFYGFHYFTGNYNISSMPSGHALISFAVATSMSYWFRRYAWIFFAIAAFITLKRIIVLGHYPSDILLGSYIGIMSAVLVKYFVNKYVKVGQ